MGSANADPAPLLEARLADRAGERCPPLDRMPDLLMWAPTPLSPLAWRDAFDSLLERRASLLARSESDSCLAQGLSLLPAGLRQSFLRAPAVAARLLDVDQPFDGQAVAELLLAELAAAGVASELHKSLWTARGNHFLDLSARERWTLPGATLGSTGIAVDEAAPNQFPDDEFGIALTMPHTSVELGVVNDRLLEAVAELNRVCKPALATIINFTEVLALRREPHPTRFYSSTFSGLAGLVRFTNAHLADVSVPQLVEALVHEAIHCILHVHEAIAEPFVRVADANDTKVISPWTGATIRLQSYVHACAVWYGVYWLWSMDGFAVDDSIEQAKILRLRARRGFECRPVSLGLAALEHLLTDSAKRFLHELEGRMLTVAS
jgi:hypothetical protein